MIGESSFSDDSHVDFGALDVWYSNDEPTDWRQKQPGRHHILLHDWAHANRAEHGHKARRQKLGRGAGGNDLKGNK